jgi:hypothetical protein
MYHEVWERDYVSMPERRSWCPWHCVGDEWFHLSALLLALLVGGALLALM